MAINGIWSHTASDIVALDPLFEYDFYCFITPLFNVIYSLNIIKTYYFFFILHRKSNINYDYKISQCELLFVKQQLPILH